MKRNMATWAQEVMSRPERIAIPIMTYPGLEIIGRNVRETVTQDEVLFQALQALVKAYPPAAVTTIMDLSLEAEAFGAQVRYADDEVPSVVNRLVTDMASVEALRVPTVHDGRIQVFVKTIKKAVGAFEDIPVLSGSIGPYSLAGRLFDMTEIMMAALLEPETVHALLKKCTVLLLDMAQAYKASGAHGIVIAEPAAGLLSPDMCQIFSSDYVKMIVDAVQDDTFTVILHNCGNTDKLVPALVASGAKGFHMGNAANMVDRLNQFPKDRLVLGNIDPVKMKHARAEDITTMVHDLLEACGHYPNFILSTGCDVPPGTPTANVRAYYAALAAYNAKR